MPVMTDGFPTTIGFAADPTVLFEEKEVTPPGIDGGDPIETATMRNTAWRTRAARKLKTLTESGLSVAYEPAVYTDILLLVNVNTEITITWPNEGTLEFWGYLQRFTPGAIVEGEQPEAEVTIIPTNENDLGAEVAPIYTAPAP